MTGTSKVSNQDSDSLSTPYDNSERQTCSRTREDEYNTEEEGKWRQYLTHYADPSSLLLGLIQRGHINKSVLDFHSEILVPPLLSTTLTDLQNLAETQKREEALCTKFNAFLKTCESPIPAQFFVSSVVFYGK